MSDFFTTDFDFEKYIDSRLLEVSDENERRALKEVLRASLLPFYQGTEEAFHRIERRVENAQGNGKGRFQIITGISEKSKIDSTEEAMIVMDPEDLTDKIVDVDEMLEALEENQPYTVMRVYVKADYHSIRKLIISRREWKGVITTNEGEYQARFRWKQNISYYQKITELYPVFEENNIPWRTVCAPYLAKFFDVDVIQTDCPADEEITKISVDFEEIQDKILYHMVPMWNVRAVEERSSAYPDFAIDQIHYEHLIFKEKIKEKRDYLICSNGIKLWEVFRQDGDIHVVCDADSPTEFQMIEFGYEAFSKKYDYETFYNESYEEYKDRCVHTKAEVKRFVEHLGVSEWLKLTDFQYMDKVPEGKKQTYSLNQFLEDEIRVSKNRDVLVFIFECSKVGHELNQDVMSYVVSCLQWKFPEFECIGEC